MKKFFLYFLFLPCLIGSFDLIVFSQQSGSRKTLSEGIEVDKTEVIIPCPPTSPSPFKCPKDAVIKIETKVVSPIKNLKYKYSVSGGQIIGNGRKVKWDLSTARPGIHEVSVFITDSKNFQKTFTRKITAPSCGSCGIWDCVCPVLTVSIPAETVRTEDKAVFTANVVGGNSNAEYTYKWKVSGGKIIKGQGKRFITVRVNKSVSNLTIEFKIKGTCASCIYTAQETIQIVPK